jgi:alkanesulfonate monooxygenase SsuD/methylene tetrahydromethanopterin reductase-like flavin-dependent oxidoreductase (luciferase family)
VKLGVLLPTRQMVMSGRREPETIAAIAERAEALGFRSVWAGDSLTARPRIEPLLALAAVGSRTRSVRLGTAIFLAALRHPILLAHQLASLDWLTGGRVDLGIGYGRPGDAAQQREFEMLGLSAAERIKRSEEIVEIVRRLWREEEVSHAGAFFSFARVALEPKPIQRGGVPIWLASNDVEPGLKRVARLADGWLNNLTSPAVYRGCLERIRAYAAGFGRDPETIEPGLYFTLAGGGADARAEGRAFLSRYYNRPYDEVARAMLCVTGSWDEIVDRIEAYREAGARTIVLRFAASDQLEQLHSCAEALERCGLLAAPRE